MACFSLTAFGLQPPELATDRLWPSIPWTVLKPLIFICIKLFIQGIHFEFYNSLISFVAKKSILLFVIKMSSPKLVVPPRLSLSLSSHCPNFTAIKERQKNTGRLHFKCFAKNFKLLKRAYKIISIRDVLVWNTTSTKYRYFRILQILAKNLQCKRSRICM